MGNLSTSVEGGTVSKHGNRNIIRHLARHAAAIAVAFGLMITSIAAVNSPVVAQEAWVERAEVLSNLSKTYTEAPVGLGLTSEGAVIELFTRPDGATWTLVITLPNGLSRIVATGEAWISIPQPVKGNVS